MQPVQNGKIQKPLSLYTKKRDESRTAAMTSLTNKNWARVIRLAEVYNNLHEKSLTEDDILNMMVNSYYKTTLKRVKQSGKTL